MVVVATEPLPDVVMVPTAAAEVPVVAEVRGDDGPVGNAVDTVLPVVAEVRGDDGPVDNAVDTVLPVVAEVRGDDGPVDNAVDNVLPVVAEVRGDDGPVDNVVVGDTELGGDDVTTGIVGSGDPQNSDKGRYGRSRNIGVEPVA